MPNCEAFDNGIGGETKKLSSIGGAGDWFYNVSPQLSVLLMKTLIGTTLGIRERLGVMFVILRLRWYSVT